MEFAKLGPKASKLRDVLVDFVNNDCIPAEAVYKKQLSEHAPFTYVPPVINELKAKARSLGLWNLFLTNEYKGLGSDLTNLEYSILCEIMGRSSLAPEACNCSAPDTGNMEVLAKYGTEAQKQKWLVPLMNGEIRSAFAMTEYNVASSDAANVETRIEKRGNKYIINGHKWWISGAPDPRNKLYILVGKSDPNNANRHVQQSVVLIPADTPGIKIIRNLSVFGYLDEPHGHSEMLFENVEVPVENIVLGEGRGFEVLQGRLGPGRIHHCMRAIGVAERALDKLIMEATNTKKTPFGKKKGDNQKVQFDIAYSRIEIEQARMIVLNAAAAIDKFHAKGARKEIAMAKIIVPQMVQSIIDRAIQVYGGGGVSQEHELASLWAHNRTLRLADGPDEVHLQQLARTEMKKGDDLRKIYDAQKAKSKELVARL